MNELLSVYIQWTWAVYGFLLVMAISGKVLGKIGKLEFAFIGFLFVFVAIMTGANVALTIFADGDGEITDITKSHADVTVLVGAMFFGSLGVSFVSNWLLSE